MRELVFLCYKTPNFRENAIRFYYSAEFNAAIGLMTQLGKRPSPQLAVLDFACGNGVASYALARAGYRTVCCDSSLGALAGLGAARQLVGQDGVQFDIYHSTGESLGFPSETFDVVWIREALHHMKDLGSFLAEIRRILKPNGIVICMREIVVWNQLQKDNYIVNHPFYHITHDEGAYFLQEYTDGFNRSGLTLEVVLAPNETPINAYPNLFIPGSEYHPEKNRSDGCDLFTFVGRRN